MKVLIIVIMIFMIGVCSIFLGARCSARSLVNAISAGETEAIENLTVTSPRGRVVVEKPVVDAIIRSFAGQTNHMITGTNSLGRCFQFELSTRDGCRFKMELFYEAAGNYYNMEFPCGLLEADPIFFSSYAKDPAVEAFFRRLDSGDLFEQSATNRMK